MRHQRIEEKTAELQRELETWAKAGSILEPGERIVFTMCIEKCDTVHHGKDVEVLLWPVERLFTYENLAQAGVPMKMLVQISDSLKRVAGSMLIKDFIKKYYSYRQLKNIPRIGNKAVIEIAKLLKKHHIDLYLGPLEGQFKQS